MDRSICLGQWMLDPRLTGKKLDVRIQGTRVTLFHNGHYENKCGFVVLKRVPTDVNDSVVVRIGFEQTQRPFLLRYLVPERTTERPGFVQAAVAKPIIQDFGERVVIIGPYLNGSSDTVGSFGTIYSSYFPLQPGHVLVMVHSNPPAYLYFDEDSICRSHVETEGFY